MGWSVFQTACALGLVTFFSADDSRVLFDFEGSESKVAWQTVNDGVMGGRSDGRFRIADDHLQFFGNLSLENNGGFTSVRSSQSDLGLKARDALLIRVLGDGREYNLNLYVSRDVSRNSFRQSFPTEKGEWVEIELPLDQFQATWRGRVFPNEPLDPRSVRGLGFQLSDKQPGPFQLDVDWIKAVSGK